MVLLSFQELQESLLAGQVFVNGGGVLHSTGTATVAEDEVG